MEMEDTVEVYDNLQYSRQGRDGLELIEKLPLTKGMSVLDLGCGTGFLASVLANRVGEHGKVIAIDPNKERIRFAKKKYGQQQNIEFLVKSSEDFPTLLYDVIFSNHVLHSIKDKSSTFKMLFENLKNGGYLAAQGFQQVFGK